MPKKQLVPHFNDFSTLMEIQVLPHCRSNPEFERLDGGSGKGNRATFATFNYLGIKWKIAMDTKIERLLVAWKMYQEEKEPFVQGNTEHRRCLRLNDGGSGKANGLFVYEV